MAEGTVAADQLRLFIERIERLEEEKKGIADDVRDVYAEAKANGYDPKIMRMIVRLRKMETHTRQEQDAVLEPIARRWVSRKERPWPAIANSRTSCTARGRRIRSARPCSPSSAAKSPSRPRWACPIPT